MAYELSDANDERMVDAMLAEFEAWLEQRRYEILDAWSNQVAAEYLQRSGEASQSRILSILQDAILLRDRGHNEAAVLRAFSSVELIVKDLLFQPLLVAVVFYPDLAEQLINELFDARDGHGRARKLVDAFLDQWGIRLESLSTSTGRKLWPTVTGVVRPKRNRIAHDGESATAEDAGLAVEVAERLLRDVAYPLATSLGFEMDTSRPMPRVRYKVAPT